MGKEFALSLNITNNQCKIFKISSNNISFYFISNILLHKYEKQMKGIQKIILKKSGKKTFENYNNSKELFFTILFYVNFKKSFDFCKFFRE